MKLYQNLRKIAEKSPFVVDTARRIVGSNLVNNSGLYQKLALRKAHKLHLSKPFGTKVVCIETTSACNAKCIMCTKRSLPHEAGIMSDTIFSKILTEAKELGVKQIGLSVYGEPLSDPKFIQRAKMVNDLGFRFYFFSNASLLTQDKAKELLLMPGFGSVYFSINGFSKKTYEEVMMGLNRDKVFENVLNFLQLREKLNSKVKVRVTCVVFEKNKHEINELKQFWLKQPGVDMVYFPAIRNRGGTTLDIETQGENPVFSPLSAKGRTLHPCRYLWEGLFVYWNGEVGVCCEDNAARRIGIGNVADQTLNEIWTGENIKNLRKLHLDGKRHLHRICGKQCSYNTAWLFQENI